jgi:thymidylate synthase
MTTDMYNVESIRAAFKGMLMAKDFTIDKTGAKTIELIGASFIADENAIFGKPVDGYIAKEIEWYESMSTNINDIYGDERDAPAAWKYAADKHGNINSNYGKLIFSKEYHNQYINVRNELVNNPDGRRAEMVYNRPSVWTEFNKGGMSDFICTNAVTYYIRNKQIHCVVQMRSNDVVFGYKNDYAWQKYVLDSLVKYINLHELHPDELSTGNIHWQVQNLHVYEKHFDLVK